ncbi:tetratricopeptide repeat protein [Sulfurimonas sp. MAG313]|nr:tetratricopeptide repeat protein [Sulfurimonas sp. MAG313]MDF1881872.1 tetratricopeptide repeat protein [Sulfurimonas sp. MAG313]
MSVFQLIMLGVSAYFAYQVYLHIQKIDEDAEPKSMQALDEMQMAEPELSLNTEEDEQKIYDERIAQADKAYMDDDLAQAKTLLESVVHDYPIRAEGMNKLAFILSKEGEDTDALLYYRASLRVAQNDDMTHNAIARLLVKMNKNDEAEEHYLAAIKIDDNYEITWFNYSELMLVFGRREEAIKMLNKALEIDPDFEEAKASLQKLT